MVSHINADEGHEALLNNTLTIYNQCFPGDTMYGSYAGARERVVEGNIAMGEGLGISLFSSVKRDEIFSKEKSPINWHDYKINGSRDALYKELHDAMNANSSNYDKLLFIGGIINLVEDLSLPIHDNIESAKVDTKRIFEKLMYDNVLCNDIDMNEQSVEEIRIESANKIASYLKQDIPSCPDVKWQEFWKDNKDKESPNFGQAGLFRLKEGPTCKFEDNDKRYKDFVYSLHLNAIDADFKLLNWSTKNILKRDKKLKF